MTEPAAPAAAPSGPTRHLRRLDRLIEQLRRTRSFGKALRLPAILEATRRVMSEENGVAAIYERIAALTEAGIFQGTDWDEPARLQPALTVSTLREADPATALLECISELRLLAIATEEMTSKELDAEAAQAMLARIVGLNLDLLQERRSELARSGRGIPPGIAAPLYRFLIDGLGVTHILGHVVDEVWRILDQRPVHVAPVKALITRLSVQLSQYEGTVRGHGAARLIAALYGPTRHTREDPGIDWYHSRLTLMEAEDLTHEASGFARAMHDTGLVSPYHAVFVRHAVREEPGLVSEALGLDQTGQDSLRAQRKLVDQLILEAIHPDSSQAIYGLSRMLNRGIFHHDAVAAALWRQLAIPLHPDSAAALAQAYGPSLPPRVWLLAGVLMVLGQPLGIGQGDSPTCQSARALSMWSYNDPDYLLQMIAWASRDHNLLMHFEGQPLSSAELPAREGARPLVDTDPVSVVVVPHLDRIYLAMGRLCVGRGEDPHRWVNPEFHGWWVGHRFEIMVDVQTGLLQDPIGFVQRFYASYHPDYDGDGVITHPQPAGIAVTDSAGRFVGWHAITILRTATEEGVCTRVYFFNPNNDSSQDWGHGVEVSTSGHGERFGESSLPIEQFSSRLYLFHTDPGEMSEPTAVPEEIARGVVDAARASWAAGR